MKHKAVSKIPSRRPRQVPKGCFGVSEFFLMLVTKKGLDAHLLSKDAWGNLTDWLAIAA